ncbi:unnamed protein product [Paramecium sonneborni]|uniref:Uncharacterized protein n=1 Tax=Paramecium sonneborni TaxID=65129 RepID=A0A8S1RNS3_9CILI|nr:unnamed protein product [Paramecium sonneborni]
MSFKVFLGEHHKEASLNCSLLKLFKHQQNFVNSSTIAHQIQLTVTEYIDQIATIFNYFKNVVQQVIKSVDLLLRKNFITQLKLVSKYHIAEPEKESIQNYMYEYYGVTAPFIILCKIILLAKKHNQVKIIAFINQQLEHKQETMRLNLQ